MVYKTSEEFNVHIRERGTKFVEKITIDEKNGLETFYVPPHNGLSEANYLYDFKNVSVQFLVIFVVLFARVLCELLHTSVVCR